MVEIVRVIVEILDNAVETFAQTVELVRAPRRVDANSDIETFVISQPIQLCNLRLNGCLLFFLLTVALIRLR